MTAAWAHWAAAFPLVIPRSVLTTSTILAGPSITLGVILMKSYICELEPLYLVAKSRGSLATGATCFDSRLAKTPHNIPATWEKFHDSDWKLSAIRNKTYQSVSRTGQELCPTPAFIVRLHKIFTSFRIQIHRITELFSFHCWGKLGKSSTLAGTSSSPGVLPYTPR